MKTENHFGIFKFSVLAEDAIKAALQDYKVKNQKAESSG